MDDENNQLKAVKQLSDSLLKYQGHIVSPAIGDAVERIQRLWRPPLAINAFASSIANNFQLPKLPIFDFPKINIPKFNIPRIDWDALHARDERALRFAARQNWFIQPETFYTFTADIDECGEDAAQLDELFMAMLKAIKTDVEKRLLADYPKHAPLIEEMFRLHDEGRFLASIPLALICAEGIAYSVTQKSVFNLDKNRPAIAGWLDKQDLPKLAKAFLASLTEQHPMSKPRPNKLSRHRVLHGNQTDYGTEIFSYQAISLLGFVGWAFAEEGLVNDHEPAVDA
ncbi:hypothetical protein V0R37_15105 [Pollutimonas sp. H1-120]|uniref:hypothetical protein n=1 Tax=Pollutimonas sp. H1-120 TaxID=3148824 RepID=UPI003B5272CA